MTNRYALRIETKDGTLEEAYAFTSTKQGAIKKARDRAKHTVATDIVRVWVDDTKTEQGVKSFEVGAR